MAAGQLSTPGAGGPRALLLLGQSPFDPASGAARSMQTMARWLARAGWQVRSLSTNASEAPWLAGGLAPQDMAQACAGGPARAPHLQANGCWLMQAHGVAWQWLQTTHQFQWEADVGPAFDALLQQELKAFQPELVLTFGDDPGDRRRRAACRSAQAVVAFALHNRAYLQRTPPDVDAFLCPSAHLAAAYQAAGFGAVSWLPAPVEAADLLPEGPAQQDAASALCLVYANPEPAKGSLLVARLVAELARLKADVPVLVAAGRGDLAGFAAAVSAAAGLPLQDLPSLMLAPRGLPPRELMHMARVVLMPSVVEEAAGRMAIEAQCVGAVPVVSNRGALPQTVAAGGLVLPLPARLLQHPTRLPSAKDITPWTSAVLKLFNDAAHWQQLSDAARRHSQQFTAGVGLPALDAWARQCLRRAR